MNYRKIVIEGYIRGVCETTGEGNISREEYNAITELMHNKPTPPDGYNYRLSDETLEWVLVEIVPEPEEATAEDYEDALGRFGV